jgi:hypothetical protein
LLYNYEFSFYSHFQFANLIKSESTASPLSLCVSFELMWLIYFYQPHFGGFILVASLLLSSNEEVDILGNDICVSVFANICKYNFVFLSFDEQYQEVRLIF